MSRRRIPYRLVAIAIIVLAIIGVLANRQVTRYLEEQGSILDKAHGHLLRGQKFEVIGNYEAAKREYLLAAQLLPDEARILRRIDLINEYLTGANPAVSIHAITRQDELLSKGLSALSRNDFESAIAFIEQMEPSDLRTHLLERFRQEAANVPASGVTD